MFKILLVILSLIVFTQVSLAEDNKEIEAVYKLDQEMRKKENYSRWPLYSPIEERSFRMTVFKQLANNNLKTANDYFRASIILIHTDEFGPENFILAAFLAERAIELGHKQGQNALTPAISKYSLHDQLPSNDWVLYEMNGLVMTKKEVEQKVK